MENSLRADVLLVLTAIYLRGNNEGEKRVRNKILFWMLQRDKRMLKKKQHRELQAKI